ncbi:MAG: bifunctional acetate--CoA ligase family protein/GNAT family N-acetyltransferase [Bryobacteraceae bacterium]|jgi:acetyltransferase
MLAKTELDLITRRPTAERRVLEFFFSPKTVAVIGASEKPESVGRTILWNLISSPFGGTVYPVNLKRHSVLGIKAYPRVAELPEPIELAVIVTPAATVPGIVRECGEAGAKGAIIISAGFREAGPAGARLEDEVLAEARAAGIRLIGPNCMGVMRPVTGFNATFAPALASRGNVAFLSQSGALCAAVLDWSRREQVGFSAFLSIGSMVDVGWGSLIDYFGNDPKTRSIVIYMESVGDARSFLSAAREVALQKPIIVIKAGRTEQAARAAASHTGALSGSDEVLDAAFRRCGVLRVNSISDIFYMTEVLSSQPRPKGPRLLIVTNAGGPGVLATDALLMAGGQLASLSETTVATLNEFLPAHWSHNNPVDIIGDADANRYVKTVEALAKNPDGDGLLVIMAPQGVASPVEVAEALRPFAKLNQRPILASWMGGLEASPGEMALNSSGIPTFPFPDMAVRAFQYMWKYSYNLRGLYETPVLTEEPGVKIDRAMVSAIIDHARAAGRTVLTEVESKEILKAYSIPVAETVVAATADEAVRAARQTGYPVVLKLHSESITHKSDVGGVQLDLRHEQAVRNAFETIRRSVDERAGPGHFQGVTVQPMVPRAGYELILGASVDAQFGPVLLFGAGGELVEIFNDHGLSLPPLNTTLARRLMEQTRIYTALQGVRGQKPVDMSALERLLVRFSQLVVEQPAIREIDINPLQAMPDRLVALDARMVVYARGVDLDTVPRPSIRPYPSRYVGESKLNDGTPVVIRPIRPEDEPLMVEFHHTLSERSVYMRYFHWMKLDQRITHDRLTRMCFIDYDRQMALVAENQGKILGVARLVRSPLANDGEVAVIISDAWHARGLGSQLTERLVGFARDEKVARLNASVLYENRPMLRILEKLGFKLIPSADPETVEATMELG